MSSDKTKLPAQLDTTIRRNVSPRDASSPSMSSPFSPSMQNVDGKFYSDEDDELWTFQNFHARRGHEEENVGRKRSIPIQGGDDEMQYVEKPRKKSPRKSPKRAGGDHTPVQMFDSSAEDSSDATRLTIEVPKKEVPLYQATIDPRRRRIPIGGAHQDSYRKIFSHSSPASRYRTHHSPVPQPNHLNHPPPVDFDTIMRDITPSSAHSDNRFSPLASASTTFLPDMLHGTDDEFDSRLASDVKSLNRQLEQHNLKVHVIVPDGNCAYRSLSYLLHKTERRHPHYREQVVKIMRQNKDKFKDFIPEDFDEHCNKQEKVGEWADNVELFAMSMLVKKKILVHQLDQEPQVISASDTYTDLLHFSYHLQCHYNAVVPLQQATTEDEDPYTQIMKLTGEMDRALIGRHLEQNDYDINNTVESLLKVQEQRHAPREPVQRLEVPATPEDDGFLTPSSFAGIMSPGGWLHGRTPWR